MRLLGAGVTQQESVSPPSVTLSFVIVSWNTKELLLQCLGSLYQQLASYTSEVIVVDNASTDGSVAAVTRDFTDVRIIQNDKNVGFAKANNIGIRSCTGKYIVLVNSDIIFRPHCIQRSVSYLECHQNIGLVGPKILNPDLSLQFSYRPFPGLANALCRALAVDKVPIVSQQLRSGLRETRIGAGQEADILSGCLWVVRRTALADVGMLDEAFFIYAEDKDWCRRFWTAGWSIVYLPEAEAIHYGGASSSSEPVKFYVEMHRANLQYWRKHHGWLSWISIRVIMLLHQCTRIVAGIVVVLFFRSRRESIFLTIKRCRACARFLLGDTSQFNAY